MSKVIRLASIAIIVSVLYFAFGTAFTFNLRLVDTDYFNLLAQSVMQGKLHITDIVTWNVYDLIAYEHKWYLPWGPLVALFIIPVRFLFSEGVHPLYISIIFGTVNVLIVWLMLYRLKYDFFPSLSDVHVILLTALFAFGTSNFYIATQAGVWQVDQMVASVFGNIGLYSIFKKDRKIRDYVISVVFISIAFLGRATVTLLAVVPVVLYIHQYMLGKNKTEMLHALRNAVLVFGIPMALGTSLFMLHNYLRFGNPLEYGYRYIEESAGLASIRNATGIFSFHYVLRNAWIMFFDLPKISVVPLPDITYDLGGNSIFFLTPVFLSIFLASPVKIMVRRLVPDPYISALWLGCIITILPSLFIYATGFVQLGYRYAHDITLPLLMLSVFGMKGKIGPLYTLGIIVAIIFYTAGILDYAY